MPLPLVLVWMTNALTESGTSKLNRDCHHAVMSCWPHIAAAMSNSNMPVLCWLISIAVLCSMLKPWPTMLKPAHHLRWCVADAFSIAILFCPFCTCGACCQMLHDSSMHQKHATLIICLALTSQQICQFTYCIPNHASTLQTSFLMICLSLLLYATGDT